VAEVLIWRVTDILIVKLLEREVTKAVVISKRKDAERISVSHTRRFKALLEISTLLNLPQVD
jgi:hypothetical protein